MGDRFGHEGLTMALLDIQDATYSLLKSEADDGLKMLFDAFFVLPVEAYLEGADYEDGVPPPPPPPHVGSAGKGGHDGHDAAGVVEAIGFLTAFAQGDLNV